MSDKQQSQPDQKSRKRSHMPDTFFFERVVPFLLVLMGGVMFLLVLFAVGVLLGIVQF